MTAVDRIRTKHHVTAMVALDSFPLIVARIQRLCPTGRPLAAAYSYATYTGRAPEVFPGLTVESVRVNPDRSSLWVETEPDFGFGVGIRCDWTAQTEESAWKHYHGGQHEADAFSDRRRDLTYVELTGGREGEDLSSKDRIVVRTYNSDGVCDERVIGFHSGGAA